MFDLSDYQLFLFDFDGLLVNSEKLHYLAYKSLADQRGYHFSIDFATYLRLALFRSDAIREFIYKSNPGLDAKGPPWQELYAQKKNIYKDILEEEPVSLMEGAEELLLHLEKRNVKRAIVTNSTKYEVERIRSQHPILKTIPYLITKEDYNLPKPSPECYLKAISDFANPTDRTVGFEDSPRGLSALLGTSAEGVFVSSIISKEEMESLVEKKFHHVSSLKHLI